ncbi:MAG: helix-turn-helix domain-containing protein [Gammaproteobacteria bacterium]
MLSTALSTAPHPSLAQAIDRFWVWESVPGQPVLLPTLAPGTGAELVCHFRAPPFGALGQGAAQRLPQAYLLALRRTPLRLAALEPVGFIAVRFRAGMLHRFVAIPGAQLHGICPVDALWGRAGAQLAEQVALAPSHGARLRLLQDFLLARQQSADRLVERASDQLYYHGATLSIDALAGQLAIGRRQLERRFKAVTGLSPVAMRRLGRLQQTLRALLLDPTRPLLETALAHGFGDQAHFNHEFKAAMGQAPLAYLAAARARPHFYQPPRRHLGGSGHINA